MPDLVVVATDVGGSKRARDMAHRLEADIAVIEKQRVGNRDRAEVLNVIGNVEGRPALIVEDEISSGGTVVAAAQALKDHGAADIYCCVTHPVLSGDAPKLIADSVINETIVTDTLPVPEEKRFSQLKVLSISGLLAEAIHRIHTGQSVGAMFGH